MSDERDRMVKALKEHVVSVLRERGVKGSFPHLRRPTERGIDLLTFHFDKWGGGFTIEIARCPLDGVTMNWGEHVPPNKVRAWDINPRNRPRLGPTETDKWFRFDNRGLFSADPYRCAAVEALPYLDEAEDWWRRQTNEVTE